MNDRPHPRHQLETMMHSPIRLSIMAILAQIEDATFAFVADTAQLSAPVLSKHVALLEKAGFVRVRKGRVGRQPRTWLSLTETGRARFAEYVQALRAITGNVDIRDSAD